ncbi:MAG: galactokinase [Desulfobacterales bacterium]
MKGNLRNLLTLEPVVTSAPCRIDMGGTLDLAVFYNPLRHLAPCTFNLAIDLRTTVRLLPHRPGRIKISSRGFESADFASDAAPFDHPLGLMFATAAYFGADGVQAVIESASPPRSALGGSSAAAVALAAAFLLAIDKIGLTPASRRRIALLAHRIEESVAGVPCGRQDQLAAAMGGVNAWSWRPGWRGFEFEQEALFKKDYDPVLSRHLLLAYCGVPHESRDVNGQWVRRFLGGGHRRHWVEIVHLTKKFIDALRRCNYKEAAAAMNRETALRLEMTPDVLDDIGTKLVTVAVRGGCGARFTGAGGGGCLWALGRTEDIQRLAPLWEEVLSERPEARLLPFAIDRQGLAAAIGNPGPGPRS